MGNEIIINADRATFSPFARVDFGEIFDHIVEFDPEAAKKFVREIVERINLLGANPAIGVAKDEIFIGLRLFPYKNYNIFYFLTKSGVEIYRILHASRDHVQVFSEPIDEIS